MMMDLEFPTEGEPVRHKAAARRLVSRVTLQVPPPHLGSEMIEDSHKIQETFITLPRCLSRATKVSGKNTNYTKIIKTPRDPEEQNSPGAPDGRHAGTGRKFEKDSNTDQ